MKYTETDTEDMAACLCSVLIAGANRGLGLEMIHHMVEPPRFQCKRYVHVVRVQMDPKLR